MWEVRAYRSQPMREAGTEQRRYATETEANNVAGALRRAPDYFCVEIRPPAPPAYFWLGAQGEAA